MSPAENPENQLRLFIPEEALDIVLRWIHEHKITLTITNSRKSVFGDYRWPQKDKGHRISVNGDLNRYAFFITLVHEMAHLIVWKEFKNTVASHGNQWKQQYKKLMDEFSGRRIFPADVTEAFKQHLVQPSHSHSIDEKLMRVLKNYDKKTGTHLSDLNENSLFAFRGNIYRKGNKLRKRFKCLELKTGREYFFNPVAEVKEIDRHAAIHSSHS